MSGELKGYSRCDDYEIVRKIGVGKHADIFEAVRVVDHKRCILKPAKPVGRARIEQEIKALLSLKGGTNVIMLYDIVRDSQMGPPTSVFEYVENTDFRRLYPTFRSHDVRYYIEQLLKALQFCHNKHIMHRDVRPHNIMIDHEQRMLRLSGWDYAQLYVPGSRYSVRVGQGIIRAPELLLQHEEYDYSIDMWNVGVILASIIFRREPFFHGVSNFDMLQVIARVLGTKGLLNYVEKYDIETDPDGVDNIPSFEQIPWQSFFSEESKHFSSTDAVDLLEKLVRWDHKVPLMNLICKSLRPLYLRARLKERITAADALKHSYFG